jgi:hypothetical protein
MGISLLVWMALAGGYGFVVSKYLLDRGWKFGKIMWFTLGSWIVILLRATS